MSTQTAAQQQSSPIEVAARIWRTVDKDAIAHRGDAFRQEAERQARRQLRSIIDSTKAGQP
jgi:hypothetical protein